MFVTSRFKTLLCSYLFCKMGNSNFQCEDLCLDDANKPSLHAKINGAKEISVQSQKVVDGYGKLPRFRKKSSASQPFENKIIEGHDSRSIFPASQPSIESQKPKSQRISKSMNQGLVLHSDKEDPKNISEQCAKLNDGYGKVSMFGKKSSAAQAPRNQINAGYESGTFFPAGKQYFGSPKPQRQGPWKPNPHSQGPSKPSPGSPKQQIQKPSKPSPGSPRPQSGEPFRSSQDPDIPPYNSKDKQYWYCALKREKALNRKLTKRLQKSNAILEKVCKQVKVLSELIN